MHTSLTASTLILQPLITGAPLMTIGLVLSAAPWVLIAAVAVFGAIGRAKTGESLRPRHA